MTAPLDAFALFADKGEAQPMIQATQGNTPRLVVAKDISLPGAEKRPLQESIGIHGPRRGVTLRLPDVEYHALKKTAQASGRTMQDILYGIWKKQTNPI